MDYNVDTAKICLNNANFFTKFHKSSETRLFASFVSFSAIAEKPRHKLYFVARQCLCFARECYFKSEENLFYQPGLLNVMNIA